jgi:hypothetical protein
MTKALLLSADGQHRPLELPDETSYEVIKEAVGGWLDTVSTKNGAVVGYLHDEGLLIGLPVNTVASLLFSRPLVGNVVLVGGLSPEGDYDGENHDLPAPFFREGYLAYLSRVSTDEELIAEIQTSISGMDFAPKVYALTDEQMNHYLSEGELPDNEC